MTQITTRHWLFILLIALATPAFAAPISVTTQQQWQDAIYAPQDGATYTLSVAVPATRGGPAVLGKAHFTVKCAPGAAFTGDQYFHNIFGMTVDGCTFNGGSLRIDHADSVSVINSRFTNANVFLNYAASSTLKGNTFVGGAGSAINLTYGDKALIDANIFLAMVGDAIDFNGISNATVTNNTESGGVPALGAHPDFLQTNEPLVAGYSNVGLLATGNNISGMTQGFFLPFGVTGRAAYNLINAGYADGIVVSTGSVVHVDHNALSGGAVFHEFPLGQLIFDGGNTVDGRSAEPGVAILPTPPVAPPAPVTATDPRDALIAALKARIAAALAALSAP